MAIKKNITIDGIEVPFKASAAVPRLYRLKFARDIYKDFASLQKNVKDSDEGESTLDIESLKMWHISWQSMLILKMCRIIPMIFWSSSTRSVFMKFFRSLLNCGD